MAGGLEKEKPMRSAWDIEQSLREALAGGPRYGMALRDATRLGDERLIRELARAGWRDEPQSSGDTCLMMAASRGASQCVEALMDISDPEAVDAVGMDALMRAAVEGSVECARQLATPSSVARKSTDGLTALMFSASNGHHECIRFLLGAGANARARDKHGRAALMFAARFGCPQSMGLLLPVSDVQATDHDGRCALMSACEGPGTGVFAERCIEMLLDAGLSENRDRWGKTALMIAARSGRWPAAQALLARGVCDWAAVDEQGKSAMDAAAGQGQKEAAMGLACMALSQGSSSAQADVKRAALGAREAGFAELGLDLDLLARAAEERKEIGAVSMLGQGEGVHRL
jgi:ankyrin repeat protein